MWTLKLSVSACSASEIPHNAFWEAYEEFIVGYLLKGQLGRVREATESYSPGAYVLQRGF